MDRALDRAPDRDSGVRLTRSLFSNPSGSGSVEAKCAELTEEKRVARVMTHGDASSLRFAKYEVQFGMRHQVVHRRSGVSEREQVVDNGKHFCTVSFGQPVHLSLGRRMCIPPCRSPVLIGDPIIRGVVCAADNVEVTHWLPVNERVEYPEPKACDGRVWWVITKQSAKPITGMAGVPIPVEIGIPSPPRSRLDLSTKGDRMRDNPLDASTGLHRGGHHLHGLISVQ